jgi:hypothetical protein
MMAIMLSLNVCNLPVLAIDTSSYDDFIFYSYNYSRSSVKYSRSLDEDSIDLRLHPNPYFQT